MKTALTTLKNGVRVATCEIPHAQSVSVALWTNIGSRHEPKELNGISHFIEHLLFKGTKKRSARRIMTDIEGVGGDINAYTSEEHTCYYATAPSQHLRTLISVLCDIYTDPQFAKADIELERAVIAEEIQMVYDDPSQFVQELLNLNFWKGHALGRPITGTLESLAQISPKDLLEYWSLHYNGANTLLTASGKLRHEDLVEMAQCFLVGLPKGKASSNRRPQVRGGRVIVEKKEMLQTNVALGLPAESFHSSQRYALALLNTVLGGNGSSRLFQELREHRGICYSVSSQALLLSDCGMLNFSLALDLKNLRRSLKIIQQQIQKLTESLIKAAEFRRAQEYVVGTSLIGLERPSIWNAALGNSILAYGKIINPFEVHEKVRAVTPEEVKQLSSKLLRSEKAVLAAVGPISDRAVLESWFE